MLADFDGATEDKDAKLWGTPAYFAPETEYNKHSTKTTDMYAVGKTIKKLVNSHIKHRTKFYFLKIIITNFILFFFANFSAEEKAVISELNTISSNLMDYRPSKRMTAGQTYEKLRALQAINTQ